MLPPPADNPTGRKKYGAIEAKHPHVGVGRTGSRHVHHHRHDEPQPRRDRHGGHGQPGTAQYVAALAHHTYDFPSDTTLAQIPTMAGKAGKPTSATEICCWDSSTPAY
jgi:hypothetical protein